MFNVFRNIYQPADDALLAETIKNGAFSVDVRSPGEFASGSVKGAVNIPLSDLSKQLSKFAAARNTVVFCRSGNRSSQAKRLLEKNGISHVSNGKSWKMSITFLTTKIQYDRNY